MGRNLSDLEPLTPVQRERLVAAMGEVERLLTMAMVEIAPRDPAATARPAARRAPQRRAAGLEASAGTDVVRLETHAVLAEAIALYRSAGYAEVAPFNDERYAHHWFEKRLG